MREQEYNCQWRRYCRGVNTVFEKCRTEFYRTILLHLDVDLAIVKVFKYTLWLCLDFQETNRIFSKIFRLTLNFSNEVRPNSLLFINFHLIFFNFLSRRNQTVHLSLPKIRLKFFQKFGMYYIWWHPTKCWHMCTVRSTHPAPPLIYLFNLSTYFSFSN